MICSLQYWKIQNLEDGKRFGEWVSDTLFCDLGDVTIVKHNYSLSSEWTATLSAPSKSFRGVIPPWGRTSSSVSALVPTPQKAPASHLLSLLQFTPAVPQVPRAPRCLGISKHSSFWVENPCRAHECSVCPLHSLKCWVALALFTIISHSTWPRTKPWHTPNFTQKFPIPPPQQHRASLKCKPY